jgi:hypothetical protein
MSMNFWQTDTAKINNNITQEYFDPTKSLSVCVHVWTSVVQSGHQFQGMEIVSYHSKISAKAAHGCTGLLSSLCQTGNNYLYIY